MERKGKGVAKKAITTKTRLKAYYHAGIREDIWTICETPEEFIDYEICLYAVKKDGRIFNGIPEIYRTDDLLKCALDSDSEFCLRNLPEKRKTKSICDYAINCWPGDIQDVPIEMRDRKMCVKSIKYDPYNITYVPKDILTYGMQMIAVSGYGKMLKKIPESEQTDRLCWLAIMNDPKAMDLVKNKNRNRFIVWILNQWWWNGGKDKKVKKVKKVKKKKLSSPTPPTTRSIGASPVTRV